MLKISTNRDFFAFADFQERVKQGNKVSRDLEMEIVANLSRIINEGRVKEIYKEARYLISRYLNYTTLYYSKVDILDFLETREHWKEDPESMEEGAAIIVDSAYKLMASFTSIMNEDTTTGFLYRPILNMMGAINYMEEQLAD